MKDVVETAIECEHCGEYTMFGVMVPSSKEVSELRAWRNEVVKAWNEGATLEEIGQVVNRLALAEVGTQKRQSEGHE